MGTIEQRKLVFRGSSEANAPRKAETCQGKLLPSSSSGPFAPLLRAQKDTLSSQNKPPSASSNRSVIPKKRVRFNTMAEEEPDSRSSKSEFQALPPSYIFLECRQSRPGLLSLSPSPCLS